MKPTINEINVAVALGHMFIVQVSEEKQLVYDVQPPEETMQSLVTAIDETYLVKTISSCGGHFDVHDNEANQKGAIVTFLLRQGVNSALVESAFGGFATKFNQAGIPVAMQFYKDFLSEDEYNYHIELSPLDDDDLPYQKRLDTDAAIETVAIMINEWTTRFANRDNKDDGKPE